MKYFLFILAVLLFGAWPARAAEVVTVSSSRIAPYQAALDGFRAAVARAVPARGLKSISAITITDLVLAEEPGPAFLRAKVLAKRPALVLAVGTNALNAVKSIADIPILYLMVPYPGALAADRANTTGVEMIISPEQQLAAFLRVIPWLRRIGLIYDPRRNSVLARRIMAAADKRGILVIEEQTEDRRQVRRLLEKLAGRIDAFWMLPDQTVTTPETVEVILLFSLENRIPVLTFSEKYLKRGATVAVTFDPYTMGERAGEMARQIIGRPGSSRLPAAAPATVKISVNHIVAGKLGLTVGAPTNNDPRE
ncbi:MAG: hypothetical protein L3J03_00515 [Desulfobacterales bacterium]|nr:hypothetical protein [Desulfobacterales bacterium]